jgi:peptidyl-prolyl cis-trans isomerase D
VVRVNKVLPRLQAAQASARQDREQYAQWWTAAETQAFYAALKERLDVQILVPAPGAPLTLATKGVAPTTAR